MQLDINKSQLSELGKSPVIIKKFYKEHFDEHNLIKEQFGNFILCKKTR